MNEIAFYAKEPHPMRIAVEHVLAMLTAGDTAETILREYPELEADDIRACLQFAHRSTFGDRERDAEA